MYDISSYTAASTTEEAMNLLQNNEDARIIAGGTDLLIRIREGKHRGSALVDISGIEDMSRVYLDGEGTLHIGPLQSFRALERNELIKDLLPGLAAAASVVGGPQIRAAATLGGNICNGATSADSASTLFCANAKLLLTSAEGERRVEIADFYKGPGKVDLKAGELLTDIIVEQKDYRGFTGHYMKFSQREAMDIATLGCAVMVRSSEEILEEVRIAYGVAGPTPRRCPEAEEALRGTPLNRENLDLFAELVRKELLTRDSWRGSKEYRDHLAGVLARRGLAKLTGQGDCDHDTEN